MRKLSALLINTIIITCFYFALCAATTNAATLTVTKTADTNDGVCNSDCSLREAIAAANANDKIVFASPLFDGAQTINLSDAAGFGELFVNKSITISGKGAQFLTIQRPSSASTAFSVFRIDGVNAQSSVSVTLEGMTIAGGLASSQIGGGGIYNFGANLTINFCHITGNRTASLGGGIRNNGTNAITTISNSTIYNNSAVVSNTGGGGIYNDGTRVDIINSTISGNTSVSGAGGIYTTAAMNITNSTITDNQSSGANSAGGIRSTSNNLIIRNTIVAANRNNTTVPDVSGVFDSQGFNLIGNSGSVTTFDEANDQTGTTSSPINPLLGSLSFNNGQTMSHSLMVGSPALDKGFRFSFDIDQRNQPRPVDIVAIAPASGGDNSDIGSYESTGFPPLFVTKTEDTNDGVCDSDCSLREAIATARTGNEIVFASPVFNTTQTITLTDATGFRELFINKSIKITGRGVYMLTIRRDPAAAFPYGIFQIDGNNVQNGASVTLEGMTIKGGFAPNNIGGGGILSNNANLTVKNCHITENTAVNIGGGIYALGTNSVTNISNSTIFNNSTINNTQPSGGGIQNGGGVMNITDSTISGNVAASGGGGIYSIAQINVTNATITDNESSGANSASGMRASGIANIRNTIIAGNRNNASVPDVSGSFVSIGFNLIGNRGSVTFFNQPSDQTGDASAPINPRLGGLADNGGATLTHALSILSPAVDKGNGFWLSTDQRGQTRPVDLPTFENAMGGDASDIGAYESQDAPANLPPVARNDSYTINEDQDLIINAPGLLANDTDTEGDTFTATLINDSPHIGFFQLNPDGSFRYLVLPNRSGTDVHRYKVNDGTSDSNIATITITVNPVNDIPVAANDSYDLRPNTTLTIPARGVLQNDTDVESDLSAFLLTTPSHGNLSFNSDGSFVYTPTGDFIGTDSFTYKANDGTADSNVATVKIYVNIPVTWFVTKTADTKDGACDSDCSLREAIAAATPGDIIKFASPLFDTAQTITLVNASGFNDLVINKSLTIIGNGANLLTIRRFNSNSNPPPEQKFRIFTVTGSGVKATLSGITMTGGAPNVFDNGGAVNNNNGSTLTIEACYINNNIATVLGGGIYNDRFSTLNVINSTIAQNQGGGGPGGGGIDNRGMLTVINSTISGNAKVYSNVAADNAGGGIYNNGTAIITSSTITGNSSLGSGSARGIYNNGTLTIRNTIVSNNFGSLPDVAGNVFLSEGYNLIGNVGSATGFEAMGDQTGTSSLQINARLDPLGNYGGATPTHRLQTNSPALDKGKNFGVTTDQRGSLRPSDFSSIANATGGDASDIGAFELLSAPTAATVVVSGRVLTIDGNGLRNAHVVLTDMSGNSQTALTGSFGYYRFEEVEVGATYIISINSKRYRFAPQFITITEAMEDLNFTAQMSGNR